MLVDLKDNFEKQSDSQWAWVQTEFKFDLGSVMLYDSYASSSSAGYPTMKLKDGTTFTDGTRVSTVDVLEIQVKRILCYVYYSNKENIFFYERDFFKT